MSDTPPDKTPAPAAEPRWAKPIIGAYSLTLFAAALGVAWWAKDDHALMLMIGAVISNSTIVVGYYFGSSAGSAQKSELLAGPPKP